MRMLFEAQVRCKNFSCKIYDKWQTVRFKKLSDFFDNPKSSKYHKCSCCQSTDVTYTSATRVYLGLAVKDAIQILSRLNADSILAVDIPFPTCENDTCFDYATNYVYEIFQVDDKDEVKMLFSPVKD